ncbi:MAG: class I SAM-dependent methyltransferase [Alphaproteobacteria bacterium]
MNALVERPAVLARGSRRRLWLGLLTILGLSRRGFFIPHRHADARPAPEDRLPYAAIEARLVKQEPQFREVLGWLDAVAADLGHIGTDPADHGAPVPRWGQSWFPRLDAAVAYMMVRRFAPRRIIEVGSGHSTRFIARAVADGGLACRITAIDPAPRADISELGVDIRRQRVQDLAPEDVAALQAGDFLLIDSSHILMPGSDVDFLLARVLPVLPAGVYVHFHDIFLPDDYPAAWDWRGYNEQLGVLPMLCDAAWEVVFASHYAVTRMTAAVAASAVAVLPLPPDAHESSLWLRTR